LEELEGERGHFLSTIRYPLEHDATRYEKYGRGFVRILIEKDDDKNRVEKEHDSKPKED